MSGTARHGGGARLALDGQVAGTTGKDATVRRPC